MRINSCNEMCNFKIFRPPLPPSITTELQKSVPSIILTSNPCRIQYCTQEIVVIREDLVTKSCRNTIHFPTSGEIPDHVSITFSSCFKLNY